MLLGEYPLLDGSYILDKINKKIEEGKDINVYEQFYLWSIQNRNKVLFWLFILFTISILANGLVNDSKLMVGGAEGNTAPTTGNNTPLSEGSNSVGAEGNTPSTADNTPKKEGRWSRIKSGTKAKWSEFKNLSNYEERKDSGKLDSYMQKRFDNRSKRAETRVGSEKYLGSKKLGSVKNFQRQALGASRDFLSFFPLIDKFFGKIWEFMFYSKISYIIAFAFLVYGFGIVVVPLTILFLLVKYSLKMYRKKTENIKAFRRYRMDYNKKQKQ